VALLGIAAGCRGLGPCDDGRIHSDRARDLVQHPLLELADTPVRARDDDEVADDLSAAKGWNDLHDALDPARELGPNGVGVDFGRNGARAQQPLERGERLLVHSSGRGRDEHRAGEEQAAHRLGDFRPFLQVAGLHQADDVFDLRFELFSPNPAWNHELRAGKDLGRAQAGAG